MINLIIQIAFVLFIMIIGGVFTFIGFVMFLSFWQNLFYTYLKSKKGESKVSDMKEGSMYAVEGKVEKFEDSVKSCFTETECVSYEALYEKKNSGTGPKSGSHVTVDKKEESVPFIIRDETGSILVNPNNDNLIVKKVDEDKNLSKDNINTQEFSPPDNFYDNHIYRATERKILTGDTVTGIIKPETKGSEIATYRAKGSSIYPARIINANWEKAMKQSVLRSIFGLIISIFSLIIGLIALIGFPIISTI